MINTTFPPRPARDQRFSIIKTPPRLHTTPLIFLYGGTHVPADAGSGQLIYIRMLVTCSVLFFFVLATLAAIRLHSVAIHQTIYCPFAIDKRLNASQ